MSSQRGGPDWGPLLRVLQLVHAGKTHEAWDALVAIDTSMEAVKRQSDPHPLQAYTVIANLIGAMALIRMGQSDEAYGLVEDALGNFVNYVGAG